MVNIDVNAVYETLAMFSFLAVELTALFLLISYLVGVLQEYIPPERIQRILSDRAGKGYIIASLLGAITPFCSCSTIPFLKGLLRAKAGFGSMMVFLFASPLLNPIIIGLFVITLGVQVTAFYFAIAMSVSIIAGYLLEKLGFEKYVKAEAYIEPTAKGCGASCSINRVKTNKWKEIWHSTWKDFKTVFPYLFAGIAVGSVIYGFMPTEFIVSVASDNNPYAIPIAAIVGIPLYIRAEAIIPLSAVLVGKGMGLGAVMALIIGSAGASLTEVLLLKSIFKNTIIIAFLFVILSMAVSAGYMYSLVF